MRRDAVEVPELIDGDSEGNPNHAIKPRCASARVHLDEVIQLRLPANAAEDNLMSQACVASVHAGGTSEQQIGCEAAILDEVEYVEGERARG